VAGFIWFYLVLFGFTADMRIYQILVSAAGRLGRAEIGGGRTMLKAWQEIRCFT
jgi:hypothetical protein